MFTQGVQSLYESNADEITREKCRAREDYISLEQAIAQKDERNVALKQILAQKDERNAALKQILAQKDERNAVLEHALDDATAQLEEYKRRFGAL